MRWTRRSASMSARAVGGASTSTVDSYRRAVTSVRVAVRWEAAGGRLVRVGPTVRVLTDRTLTPEGPPCPARQRSDRQNPDARLASDRPPAPPPATALPTARTPTATLPPCPSSCRNTAAPRSATPSGSAPSPSGSSAPAKQGNDVVVVVSAMGETTDELLERGPRDHPASPSRASSTCCSPPASGSRCAPGDRDERSGLQGRLLHRLAGRASSPTPSTARRRSSRSARDGSGRRSTRATS